VQSSQQCTCSTEREPARGTCSTVSTLQYVQHVQSSQHVQPLPKEVLILG
jgi:hypothetical protein